MKDENSKHIVNKGNIFKSYIISTLFIKIYWVLRSKKYRIALENFGLGRKDLKIKSFWFNRSKFIILFTNFHFSCFSHLLKKIKHKSYNTKNILHLKVLYCFRLLNDLGKWLLFWGKSQYLIIVSHKWNTPGILTPVMVKFF